MPQPLPGLTAIAEFGSSFEAESAAVLLRAEGIDATVLGDPVTQVGRYLSSELYFTVAVNDADVGPARDLLRAHGTDAAALDPPAEPLPWKPALGVVVGVVVFLAIVAVSSVTGGSLALALAVYLGALLLGVALLVAPSRTGDPTARSRVWEGPRWRRVVATIVLLSLLLPAAGAVGALLLAR